MNPLSQRERVAKPGEGEKLDMPLAFGFPPSLPHPYPLSRWERGDTAAN